MVAKPARQRGLGFVGWLVAVLLVGGVLLAAYIWLMLHWSYSSGERAGWVQKLSKKGFLCKTWEGEMAMVSLPGSVPEKFDFTAWDDQVAEHINQVMGKRVSLHYEEHIWLPTSCLGDTPHFVTEVRVIDETPAPMIVPGTGGAAPPAGQPPAK
ncbi:MAG: hypothetical protein C5B46_06695 [Proteobacteria bacterium]|nr:MAG: hypothetical protein C5B46_06695 [Pseudomonadota bacterium]